MAAAVRVAELPVPLQDFGFCSVGSYVYIVGGYHRKEHVRVSAILACDASSAATAVLAGAGDRDAGAAVRGRHAARVGKVADLPCGVADAGVCTMGGKIYVVSGRCDGTKASSKDVLVFDGMPEHRPGGAPPGSAGVTKVAALTQGGRINAGCCCVGDMIVIVGGNRNARPFALTETKSIWVFDPRAGEVVQEAEMPTWCTRASVCAVGGGRVVIAGGMHSPDGYKRGTVLRSILVYDLATNTVRAAAQKIRSGVAPRCVAFAGKVFILDHAMPSRHAHVEMFDPATDAVVFVGTVPELHASSSRSVSRICALGENGDCALVLQGSGSPDAPPHIVSFPLVPAKFWTTRVHGLCMRHQQAAVEAVLLTCQRHGNSERAAAGGSCVFAVHDVWLEILKFLRVFELNTGSAPHSLAK